MQGAIIEGKASFYVVYTLVCVCMCVCVITGKTTLADCLVASNGIISSRLAGKVCDVLLSIRIHAGFYFE